MRWLLALAFAACTPATAPTPIANTAVPGRAAAPPDGRCARKLPWVDKTTYFHYAEVQNGHFGNLEFHADFNRLVAEDTFNGVVVLTYRDRQDHPPKVEARTMTIPATEIARWLRKLRDHVQEPPDPPDSNAVSVHDSSRSMHMSIEAVPYEEIDGEGSVEFYSEVGERSPTPWGIRGCRSDPRRSALKAIGKVVDDIYKRIGRDAMFAKLGVIP
jgi:hypothetical protein